MNTNSSLTTSKWLADATAQLNQAGIATARLDSLVLLEDSTGIDRAMLLAQPHQLQAKLLKKLNSQLAQRANHTPLAYIRGKTEFYGRMYRINHSVLEPRPESETMIDILKNIYRTKETKIIDIGCGSGALAITAKLEIPEAYVIATDIDEHCLRLSVSNAKKLHSPIDFRHGDLLGPLADLNNVPLILLCNLPYVPDSFQINPAALQEPRQAIFGGADGLAIYRNLFSQLNTFRRAPTYVLSESMPPQHQELASIAAEVGFDLQQTDDFIQQFYRD